MLAAVALAALFAGACSDDDSTSGGERLTTTTPVSGPPPAPLVIGSQAAKPGTSPPTTGDCAAVEYAAPGSEDAAGGGGAEPDAALARFVHSPRGRGLPPRGYHRVDYEGFTTFVFVSNGAVKATVTVGGAPGRHLVTASCRTRGEYGPPDPTWQAP